MKSATRRSVLLGSAAMAMMPGAAYAQRKIADLVILSVQWSDNLGGTWHNGPVPDGSDVLFRATVRNRGTAAVSTQQRIRVDFRVNDQLVSFSDTRFGLGRGSSVTLQANNGPDGNAVWETTGPGAFSVRAVVDPGLIVPESNDSNNTFTASLTVEGSGGEPGVFPITNFGPWVADNSSSATREANRATMANAIATVGVGGGGVIDMLDGHYWLQQANIQTGTAAILINQNNITLRGRGVGRTVLHTRSDFLNVNGSCVRGHGIRVVGTTSASAPRANVTLEKFEIDGGSGFTGNFGFPANPTTGDGWDITHKAMILSQDDNCHNISVTDVYAHSYKGEMIYTGGFGMQTCRLTRVRVDDTNASCHNISAAADLIVDDCEFGRSRFWCEMAQNNRNGTMVTRRTSMYDSMVGVNQGAGYDFGGLNASSSQAQVLEDCRMISAGAAIGFLAGIAPTVSLDVRRNYIESVQWGAIFGGTHGGTNQNVTYENNILVDSGGLFDVFGPVAEAMIATNTLYGRAGTVEYRYCCSAGTTRPGMLVSNNTFFNAAPQSTQGTAPFGAPVESGSITGSAPADLTAPTQPSGLAATVGVGAHRDVWLWWNNSTDARGVSRYRVYRNNALVATVKGRSHMDRNLAAATSFSYQVSAVDFAGNESARSSAVQALTP